MVRDDHSYPVVKIAQLVGLQGLDALQLQVDQWESRLGRLAQDRQLGWRPIL